MPRTMKLSIKQSKVRTIRSDDPMFMLHTGFSSIPRASFEFGPDIPESYKGVIRECIKAGWLKPVAHMYGKEYTMDALR